MKAIFETALQSSQYREWFARWWRADFSVQGCIAKGVDEGWNAGQSVTFAGREWMRPRLPPHDVDGNFNDAFFHLDFSEFKRSLSQYNSTRAVDLRGAFVPGFQFPHSRPKYAVHYDWACVIGNLVANSVELAGSGFEDAIFLGEVAFDASNFETSTVFHRAIFLQRARFANVQYISADEAVFCGQLQLASTIGRASFAKASVKGPFELGEASRVIDLNVAGCDLQKGSEVGQGTGWYEHSHCLDFSGSIIAGSLEFAGGRHCEGVVRLDETRIKGDLRTRRTTFQNVVSLRGCLIEGDIDLTGSNFQKGLTAVGAQVGGGLLADHAVFHTLNLSSAQIDGPVQIRRSQIEREFVAERLRCKQRVALDFTQFDAIDFRHAECSRGLSMRAVHSSSGLPDPRAIQNCDFTGAIFGTDEQYDCADFSHRRFVASANFNSVHFDGIPRFHEAGLHEDTSFADATFGMRVPKKAGSERARVLLGYEAAFRSLKHRMEQIRSNRDWRRFHRLELRVRRMRKDKDAQWLEGVLSFLYEMVSDYGESIGRPIGFVFALVVLMSPIYWVWAGEFSVQAGWAAFLFSWEQLFRPFALWRVDLSEFAQVHASSGWLNDLLGIETEPFNYFGLLMLRLVTSLHSIASFTLLFLFGLAIRRRFQVD